MAHRRPFLKPDLPRVCIPEVTLLSLLPLQSYRIAAAVLLPGAYLYYRRHCVSSACRRFHSLRSGFPLSTTPFLAAFSVSPKNEFLSGRPEVSFAPCPDSFHHRESQRPQGRPGHLHTERKGANPADQSGSNHPRMPAFLSYGSEYHRKKTSGAALPRTAFQAGEKQKLPPRSERSQRQRRKRAPLPQWGNPIFKKGACAA